MAVAIMGGLVTSTSLTLFIVPYLYLRFGQGSVRTDEIVPVPQAAG